MHPVQGAKALSAPEADSNGALFETPDRRFRSLELGNGIEAFDFDPPCQTELIRVWQYWSSKCGADGLPPYHSVDMIELRSLTRNFIVTKVHWAPTLDFEIIFCSDHVDARLGRSYNNTKLSEFSRSQRGTNVWHAYETVVQTAKPAIVSFDYIGPIQGFDKTIEIFMPLIDEVGGVSHVLVALDFPGDRDIARHETRWYRETD